MNATYTDPFFTCRKICGEIVLTREHQIALDRAWYRLYGRHLISPWQKIRCALQAALQLIASFVLNNTAETAFINLYFQNTAAANIGNAGGLQPSTVAGSFFISLHTANPGVTGNQTTSEAAYSGYTRVAVARSAGGWTSTGNQPAIAENAAAVTFPISTSGPEVETYFGIGTATSGAGSLIISAILSSSLTVNNGITPSFAINALQFQAN